MENKYYFFKKMYKDYVVILESKGKYKSFGYDKELIKYIKNKDIIDIQKLQDFPEESEELLLKYTKMPEQRAEKIAETIEQKIEYLQLFLEGKKIWKREKYW